MCKDLESCTPLFDLVEVFRCSTTVLCQLGQLVMEQSKDLLQIRVFCFGRHVWKSGAQKLDLVGLPNLGKIIIEIISLILTTSKYMELKVFQASILIKEGQFESRIAETHAKLDST